MPTRRGYVVFPNDDYLAHNGIASSVMTCKCPVKKHRIKRICHIWILHF